MIKINPNGKDWIVLNKIRYRCDILPDPGIPTLHKTYPIEARPSTIERIEYEGPSFPGLNVQEDTGTVVEKENSTLEIRVRCEHGSHWESVGCGICNKLQKDQIKLEMTQKDKAIRISTKIDELERLKTKIAQRLRDDPDFADEDVIEYEKLRIAELAKMINKETIQNRMSPRIAKRA